MSVIGEAAAGKPRILLSIVKSACFESLGESETLFTSITAGFGRFECERLLKPSGVELMNLPLTANIEICVLRRDPATGHKQLLQHGLVPLASVNPVFVGAAPGEPQIWESWLGLFSSDVSLKDQSPDRLFQRCLEMGTSSARFPRLLVRMQHLGSLPAQVPPSPGIGAAPRGILGPPTAGQTAAAVSQNFHKSMVGKMSGAPPASSPGMGFTPSVSPDGPVTISTSPNAARPTVPPAGSPSTGLPARGSLPARPTVPPAGYPGRLEADGAWVSTGPLVGGGLPEWNRRVDIGAVPPASTSLGTTGRETLGGRGPSKEGSLAFESAPLGLPPQRSPSRGASDPRVGVDWREKYEELANRMSHSQSTWDEKRKALESALQEAEKSAYHKAERAGQDEAGGPGVLGSFRPATPAPLQQDGGGESPARVPNKLAAYAKQCADLQKQVADLQQQSSRLEQENLGLHERAGKREATLGSVQRQLVERLAPALEQFGRPLGVGKERVTVTTEGILAETVAALVDAADAPRSPAAPPLALLEEAVARAAEGDSGAFEAWRAGELDAGERAVLEEGAPRLLATCATVVAQGAAEAPPEFTAFYVPVKTDPVDCLLAAQLLRLGGPPPDFARLKPGVYRFGPHGLRLSCQVGSQGVLRVQMAGEDMENIPEASAGTVDFSQFLAEHGFAAAAA